MKVPVFFLFLIANAQLYGQVFEPLRSRSIFKFSPQHIIHYNNLKLGVERFNSAYSNSWVIFMNGIYHSDKKNNSSNYHKSAGAELQYRKYLRALKIYTSKTGKEYYRGIYAMVCAQAAWHDQSYKSISYYRDPVTTEIITAHTDYRTENRNAAFTMAFGVQKVLGKGILLDGFAGGGIQFSELSYSNSDWFACQGMLGPTHEGFLLKIGLHIGLGL